MTNTTIPQIGLPAKEWYTLPEVAERWTGMTGEAVGAEDVLHYGQTDRVEMCRMFDWIGLDTMPIRGQLLAIDPLYICDFSKEKPENMPWGWVHIPGDKKRAFNLPIHPKNGDVLARFGNPFGLVVTPEELQRFEQAHGLGQPAQLPKLQEASEDTKAARLERALGALALGLAKSSPKWRNGEAPNVSGLTAAALDAIKQNEDGSRPRGYGESSIYDAISAAIKAVQKDRATS